MLMQVLFSCKSKFRDKNPVLPIEKFPFLVLARNTIMFHYLNIHFSRHYLSNGRLREVKNKGKFPTFSSKLKWSRSLTRGGHLQEVLNIVI